MMCSEWWIIDLPSWYDLISDKVITSTYILLVLVSTWSSPGCCGDSSLIFLKIFKPDDAVDSILCRNMKPVLTCASSRTGFSVLLTRVLYFFNLHTILLQFAIDVFHWRDTHNLYQWRSDQLRIFFARRYMDTHTHIKLHPREMIIIEDMSIWLLDLIWLNYSCLELILNNLPRVIENQK